MSKKTVKAEGRLPRTSLSMIPSENSAPEPTIKSPDGNASEISSDGFGASSDEEQKAKDKAKAADGYRQEVASLDSCAEASDEENGKAKKGGAKAAAAAESEDSGFGDSSDEEKSKKEKAKKQEKGADAEKKAKGDDSDSGFGSSDEDGKDKAKKPAGGKGGGKASGKSGGKGSPEPDGDTMTRTASGGKGEGDRRGSCVRSRRGEVSTSVDFIFKSLRAKYEKMEQLDKPASAVRGSSPTAGRSEDMELIRLMEPSQFVSFLGAQGVPVQDYGKIELKTKPLVELWLELIFRKCSLEYIKDADANGNLLKRTVKVAFLEVEVMVDGEPRFLLLKDDTVDGKTRTNMNTRPSAKMFGDEDVEDAAWRCLLLTLNVSEKFCQQNFEIASSSTIMEEKSSAGFPGIQTVYDILVARLVCKDPAAPALLPFGLPSGSDFTRGLRKGLAGTGSVRSKTWRWCTEAELAAAKAASAGEVRASSKAI